MRRHGGNRPRASGPKKSRLAGVSLPCPHAGLPFSNREKIDERRLAQKPPPTRPPPAAPPVEEWPTLVTRRLKFDRPVVTWAAFRGYPPPSVSEGYGQRPKKVIGPYARVSPREPNNIPNNQFLHIS
ncbi:hypothetical protein PVAP13_5NG455920 [Panicum virgatum]|uniref:Uncharacterized protein n=1 Tax=Panicum virgatum TaxID=38727 RepID=A0A8T0S2C3_PANVG|nr:hypothetical protein PVAP13_5NG455920 [Panicum virgatum]